jgi:hypothetical protein
MIDSRGIGDKIRRQILDHSRRFRCKEIHKTGSSFPFADANVGEQLIETLPFGSNCG